MQNQISKTFGAMYVCVYVTVCIFYNNVFSRNLFVQRYSAEKYMLGIKHQLNPTADFAIRFTAITSLADLDLNS